MTSLLTSPAPARSPLRRATPSPAIVLAIILTCQLMIILDISIVITALPHIAGALDFSPTSLSWVQNAYTLAFGGLLLLGARAGDILGRRRMLVAGIAIFSLASLAGGLAQSAGWLLAARAVQGVGAAIAAPATLALLTITFSDARERIRAVAAYSAVSAGGGSIGLVVGGMLTTWASWRWGLLVNVPIGIALICLAPRFLPEGARQPGRFDLAGAITSTVGMTALVYGFVRAAADGWGERGTVASFVAGVTLLALFVLAERRAEQPITPLRLFASRERSGAYLARMLLVAGNFSTFFFLTQYLQGALGFSALQAGVAFLPMTIAMFAAIRVVPRICDRVGAAWLLIGGMLLAVLGMAWLTQISADTAFFPQIALPMVIFGAGTGIAFGPLTSAGLAGVGPSDAGAASGMLNVSQQLGGSLGLGILVTVFAAASGPAQRVAEGVAAQPQAREALAHGVAAALTGSTLFLLVAVGVVIAVMRPARVAAVPRPVPLELLHQEP
jgi:EmrB/QacA subfamily drug resistance transporter